MDSVGQGSFSYGFVDIWSVLIPQSLESKWLRLMHNNLIGS